MKLVVIGILTVSKTCTEQQQKKTSTKECGQKDTRTKGDNISTGQQKGHVQPAALQNQISVCVSDCKQIIEVITA